MVRSSPVTVSVLWPGWLLAPTSWRMRMPSSRTVGVPLMVVVMITRPFGSKNPSGRRRWLISPVLDRSKASWKPLRSPAVEVIWAYSSASVTSVGAGLVSLGPR